jgi:hypothetical protein
MGMSEVERETIQWKVPTLDIVVSIPLADVFAGLT